MSLSVEAYKADREAERVLFRARLDAALLIARSLITINGAGAVGILTYVARRWEGAPKGALTEAGPTLGGALLVLGAVAAVGAAIVLHMSLRAPSDGPSLPQPSRLAAWLFVVSLGMFAAGAFWTLRWLAPPFVLGQSRLM